MGNNIDIFNDMTIKNVRNTLLAEMLCSLAAVMIIAILFETDRLLPGLIEKDSQAEFLLLTGMELLTICTIPVAMRLFKFSFVNHAIAVAPERGLLCWGSVRMFLVCVPMIANAALYYLTAVRVAFFYMAAIGVICLVFINPTMKRCLAETER